MFDRYVVLMLSLTLLFIGFYFSSDVAQSETIGTPGYDLSATPPPPPQPVYATVITGHVVDEDGNGVPGATVTLLENGKIWQFSGKVHYNGGDQNPVSSGIRDPGSFTFGEVAADNCTIIVEKDGFSGLKDFYVSVETGRKFGDRPLYFSETSVNVTLKGYRLPTFNSTQRSYGGAITGTISDSWYNKSGANVSLWQNGKMMSVPQNPQLSDHSGNYLFEHLAPGRYEVRAEAGDGWASQNNSTSVTVENTTTTADLVIYGLAHHTIPVVTFAPTPEATNVTGNSTVGALIMNASASSEPTPFPEAGFTLVAVGIAAVLICGLCRFTLFKR